jgi:hypothetical protein
VSADAGKYLRMVVSATNVRGTVVARTVASPAVTNAPAAVTPVVVAPVNTVMPSIAGVAQQGTSVTSRVGGWTGTSLTYSYAWRRCTTSALSSCVAVAGVTVGTLPLTASDVGKYIRLVVTGTNSRASVSAVSNPLGPVS